MLRVLQSNKFRLLDGDKIITLYAIFIKKQLETLGLTSEDVRIGVCGPQPLDFHSPLSCICEGKSGLVGCIRAEVGLSPGRPAQGGGYI